MGYSVSLSLVHYCFVFFIPLLFSIEIKKLKILSFSFLYNLVFYTMKHQYHVTNFREVVTLIQHRVHRLRIEWDRV